MAKNQRERAAAKKAVADKRPTAIARYIRISSQKVMIVLDLIRGKSYEEAVVILQHTNKSSCAPVLKVLNSAAANAEHNLNMPKDTLYVAECYALQGPTLKRMMPRAKGSADRILKRTSHIRIYLDEKKVAPVVAKPKAGAAKKPAAKPAPKATPKTGAEKPITDKPNTAKKPLGEKKIVKKEGAE